MGDVIVTENSEPFAYLTVEQTPEFLNTPQTFTKEEKRKYFSRKITAFIQKKINLTFWKQFSLTGKQKILVAFEINKNGMIENIRVRAPHPKISKIVKKAALRNYLNLNLFNKKKKC